MTLLPAPIGINAPIGDLERLWLETSCYYAVFNETVMADEEWDQMAVELWERRTELSAFFTNAVGLPWPAVTAEEGENPLKTAMGVNWELGLPAIVVDGINMDGPARLAMWRNRIEKLKKEAAGVGQTG